MRGIPRRNRVIATWVVSALALAAVAVAGWFVGPPAYRALVPQTASERDVVTLTAGESVATVAITPGWSYRLPFNDDAGIDLTSPDGVMTVSLQLHRDVDAQIASAEESPGPLEAWSVEDIATGELFHARTSDGLATVGAMAVDSHAVTFVSTASPEYDAELAQLLTGIVVQP